MKIESVTKLLNLDVNIKENADKISIKIAELNKEISGFESAIEKDQMKINLKRSKMENLKNLKAVLLTKLSAK
jgi:predicted  nucleic acid-binding Zn-ribbon protein